MKTYYAVTEGEYSDYRIITITENKEKAKRIAAAYDGDVEEYEDCIINPIGVWNVYYYEKIKNWFVIHSNRDVEDIKDKEWKPDYFDSAPYDKGMVWTIYLWNVGKYLSRAGHKDGNSQLQDLTKARCYLDYKIRLLEEQQKVAESVVDTLKKVPNEVTDKLTTMPYLISRHAKPDYTDDLVLRPEIHTPNIETAVVPDCADEVKF